MQFSKSWKDFEFEHLKLKGQKSWSYEAGIELLSAEWYFCQAALLCCFVFASKKRGHVFCPLSVLFVAGSF